MKTIIIKAAPFNKMKAKKLKTGDLVVLRTSWVIIYKLIKLSSDGLHAICMNFRGEQKQISVFNLEKYYSFR